MHEVDGRRGAKKQTYILLDAQGLHDLEAQSQNISESRGIGLTLKFWHIDFLIFGFNPFNRFFTLGCIIQPAPFWGFPHQAEAASGRCANPSSVSGVGSWSLPRIRSSASSEPSIRSRFRWQSRKVWRPVVDEQRQRQRQRQQQRQQQQQQQHFFYEKTVNR